MAHLEKKNAYDLIKNDIKEAKNIISEQIKYQSKSSFLLIEKSFFDDVIGKSCLDFSVTRIFAF